MAVGDIVSDIQSVLTAAHLDFQPGAGVEVMITEVGSSGASGSTPDITPNVNVKLYDGSLESTMRFPGEGTAWSSRLKLFLNNTRRLRLTNADASTQNLSYCGIQTK